MKNYKQFNEKYVDVYTHQDENAERIISYKWKGEGGNVWRYKFENAGDILREFSKFSDGFIDRSYLFEKLNKIETFIEKWKDGFHPLDSYATLVKENKENLDKLRTAYETQPFNTQAQELSIKLALALINGKLQQADFYESYIRKNIEALIADNKNYCINNATEIDKYYDDLKLNK